MVGSHKSLYYWFNRRRAFRFMGNSRIVQNAGQTGVRLFRDLFTNGHWGLAIGFIIGEFFSWIMLAFSVFRKEFWRFRYLSFKSIIRSLKEHKNFPFYLMPMGVLNSFAVYLLIFALSFITTSAMVGHYERAWRVINFPLSLISASFGNVFYERMNRSGNRNKLYIYSYFGNLFLAILILFPVAIWGESIFSFVLGSDWAIAGQVARIILPLTIFSFATECVSTIFSVVKKNQILLVWQVFYLLFAVGWIYFSKQNDLFFILKVYSSIGAFLYLLLAIIGYFQIERAKVDVKLI